MKRNVLLRLLVGGLIFVFLLTAALPAANGQEIVRRLGRIFSRRSSGGTNSTQRRWSSIPL